MIFVDAHVHIHPCFQIDTFLRFAYENLNKLAKTSQTDRYPELVLLFTESVDENAFEEIKKNKSQGIFLDADHRIKGIIEATAEPESLVMVPECKRGENPLPRISLIAGRQYVSAEKLEVLTIGTLSEDLEGLPTMEILNRNAAAGHLSILPWGFGKWIKKRGAIIDDVLSQWSPGSIYFGDNGNRVAFTSLPKKLQVAEKKGFQILSGTDPLPLPSETKKGGRLATKITTFNEVWDMEKPFDSLKRCLNSSGCKLETVGRFENPAAFAKNQFYMQYRKRFKR